MSRKLYLDDDTVAALQDALTPMLGRDPVLDRGIKAVNALRRSTPKNWAYRTIDSTGKVWDWSALHNDPRTASDSRLRYASNQREYKSQADKLSKVLAIPVSIERIEYKDGSPVGAWAVWYEGKADKA